MSILNSISKKKLKFKLTIEELPSSVNHVHIYSKARNIMKKINQLNLYILHQKWYLHQVVILFPDYILFNLAKIVKVKLIWKDWVRRMTLKTKMLKLWIRLTIYQRRIKIEFAKFVWKIYRNMNLQKLILVITPSVMIAFLYGVLLRKVNVLFVKNRFLK